MTQSTQLQILNYSCNLKKNSIITPITFFCLGECLVNAKIPVSLFAKLETRLRSHLYSSNLPSPIPSTPTDQLALLEGDEVLVATIESLRITEDSTSQSEQSTEHSDNSGDIEIDNTSTKKHFKVYLYKYPETPSESTSSDSKSRIITLSDESESNDALYTLETFPSSQYTNLWDSLQFDSLVKSSILAYTTAIFKFSLLGLTQQDEISFNRILLLHGPPGTGKYLKYLFFF